VDMIGGLVTAAVVPNRGEILTGPGEFEFEVLDADSRRHQTPENLSSRRPRRRAGRIADGCRRQVPQSGLGRRSASVMRS
jgi:hypothetical protein